MKTSNFRIWLLFFVTTVVMALIAQLLILPVMFPVLHAGHGLLVGGDWIGFHQIAQELAERIQSEGWSAWELRPYGHSPAGIAAAFYAVFVSEPYALIPFNAAVHASSGVILMIILHHITGDRLISLLGAIPFVAFPSAATWYAQIHRDGYYILGMLLFCYGWVRIAANAEHDQRWWQPSFVLILSVFLARCLCGLQDLTLFISSLPFTTAGGFVLSLMLWRGLEAAHLFESGCRVAEYYFVIEQFPSGDQMVVGECRC